ncbi:hypothetical protein HanPSC8_Chr09g0351791 [Helianthus annuus]|nr:hypothetical protein HanPSC8_Chr09g0351791 [Helianthus annuus]
MSRHGVHYCLVLTVVAENVQRDRYLLLKMCKETFEGASGIIESKR